MQKKETGPSFIPYTEIYLKWIKFLNMELKTLKLLEEIKGKNLTDIDTGKIFKNMTLKAQGNKAKNREYQIKKPLHSKRDNQWNAKATYGM